MSNYEFTEKGRKLSFECSDCGNRETPEVKGATESDRPLIDYVITVACRDCGREIKANLWDCDIQEVR